MKIAADLITGVRQSFPEKPIPDEFFWNRGGFSDVGDIPEELERRVAGQLWCEITMNDWLMIGVPPNISGRFMHPKAFLYYLPSLLIAVIADGAPVEYGLEVLVPNNQRREPRGEWWACFTEMISQAQRQILKDFLLYIRDGKAVRLNETDEILWNFAAKIWL